MSGPSPRIHNIAPFFFVKDIVAAAEFYRDKLGFGFRQYWGEPPCFVMVNRDDQTIMLALRDGAVPAPNRSQACDAWDAYLWVTGIHGIYEEYKAAGVKVVRELEETFYDMIEFEIEDLDGHVLCFGSGEKL